MGQCVRWRSEMCLAYQKKLLCCVYSPANSLLYSSKDETLVSLPIVRIDQVLSKNGGGTLSGRPTRRSRRRGGAVLLDDPPLLKRGPADSLVHSR